MSEVILTQNKIHGRIPEWPKGTDCKSAVNDFGGSNPPSPTKLRIEGCGVLLFSRRFPNYFISFCENSTGSRTTIFGCKPVLFFVFPLLLAACRGQSHLACCLSLRDIDANPDANVDGTKCTCLDRTRNNSDTRLLFLCSRALFFAFFQRSCILGMTLPTIRAASCCIRLVECV